MAKSDPAADMRNSLIAAQNSARDLLPRDTQERIALIFNYDLKVEAEKKAIEEVKDEVDAAGALTVLVKNHGMEKDAIAFLRKVKGKDSLIRARILAQVFGYADDFGWFLRDLFDHNAVGVGSADAAGDAPVFDKTSEGKRRGGNRAEPRTTDEMAATHQPAPTPGLDLSTPEARAAVIKQYEEYLKIPPRRGPVPQAARDLKAAAEKARDIEAQGVGEVSANEPAVASEPAAAEQPSNVIPISQQMREANAAGDEHIRKASGRAAVPEEPAQQAQETMEEPAKPKAARKPRKAKDAPVEAAPPAPPAEDEPPAPPSDDDDDDGFPDARPVHRGIGDQPSSFTVG